jgi:subtilase family serine protease
MFGLPLLGPSNFNIIYTPTASLCEAPDSVEINIDVEWAHAIAPAANIDLVVPPSASFQDVDQALFYAVNYGLGSVISGSYASIESFTPPAVLDTREPDCRRLRQSRESPPTFLREMEEITPLTEFRLR